MKRYNSRIKILFSALLAVTAASIFSACDGVVFHDIRKEDKILILPVPHEYIRLTEGLSYVIAELIEKIGNIVFRGT